MMLPADFLIEPLASSCASSKDGAVTALPLAGVCTPRGFYSVSGLELQPARADEPLL